QNLYVKLTNLEGSTIAPPTIVHTYIVLAVGNHQPSLPRLKQLAQNIQNSSEVNLGLNRTVFGKVKQIRLSSFLRDSLTSGHSNGSPSPASAPVTGMKQSAAPAPAPASQHSTAHAKAPLSFPAPLSDKKLITSMYLCSFRFRQDFSELGRRNTLCIGGFVAKKGRKICLFLGVDQQVYRKRDKAVPPPSLVRRETKERLASDANANGAFRVSSLIRVHTYDG
ncbi:hypothetical protein BHE74_00050946, partial [Ensete ventricosum]